MASFFRSMIRTSAFMTKEMREILRQPRLILTLVLGPFLILLLFGVGYRVEQQSLRTAVVVQANNPLRQDIEQRAKQVGPPLIMMGVTEDEQGALARLRRGELDLVIVAPPNIDQSIRNNKQAVFTLYHNQINPFQVDYIDYLGRLYSDDLNKQVAVSLAGQVQAQAPEAQQYVASARTINQAMLVALRAGDVAGARQQATALSKMLDNVTQTLSADTGAISILGLLAPGGRANGNAAAQLAAVRKDTDAALAVQNDGSNTGEAISAAQRVDQDLTTLQTGLHDVQTISPSILVSPFATQSANVADWEPRLVDYYSPAVIALLLQHLALTFAALSIVRESRLGAMELFKISPLSAIETLIGKYLGYMIVGAVLAALLAVLMIYGLGVPLVGDWRIYGAIMAALLFAALGMGFILSLLSQTESQAVQYSMIFLLTSVFFSGFFLRLDSLWEPIRVLSYLLPVTYAMPLLQNVALRGHPGDVTYLVGLVALGVVMMLLAWLLLRRRIHVAGS